MADVARLAGVSAMTVSRALRRESSVSEQTRARVLEVVEEIGYVPDQSAGALSSGRSGLVAAIVPSLGLPLFAQVASGLGETLAQAGLELFLKSSDYNADRESEIIRTVLKRRPEALAIAGVGPTSKASRLLSHAGIPVVEFLDSAEPSIDNVIGLDYAEIGRATVRYLKSRGRSRIGVVTSRDSADRRSEIRLRGLATAAQEAGLPEPIALRHALASNPAEQGARGARSAVEQKLGLDALVFMNDHAAIGGIGALRRLGVRTPEDIAVFGFGNCELATFVEPALTTIAFNPVAAGVEIGKVVLSALESARLGLSRQTYRLMLDFQIVERESA